MTWREQLNVAFDDFIRTAVRPAPRAGGAKALAGRRRQRRHLQEELQRPLLRGLRAVLHARRTDARRPVPRTPDPPRTGRARRTTSSACRATATSCCDLIESGEFRIIPESRRNEVVSFIRMGLADFSISRSQERAQGLGHPRARRPQPGDLRLVRRADQLYHRAGLCHRGPLFQHYWAENAQPGATASARASSASTPSTGRRCCCRRGCARPARCSSTAT